MAIYIDFNKNIKNIFWQFENSDTNIDTKNDLTLFDYYKFVNDFRHDFLHYLVLQCLGLDWKEEDLLSNYFDLPDEYARKTPDIVFKKNETWFILDVSTSFDLAKTKIQKETKYLPIITYLKTVNKLSINYIHINVDPNYSNLYEEIYKLDEIRKYEFDYDAMFRAHEKIEDKKRWISDNIDKKTFEELKTKAYNKKVYNETDKDLFFKDRLMYENIGSYNDLDIDLDIFKQFNNRFNLESIALENYDKFDEKELINFFTEVLNNKEDPLFKKYKDDKLTDEQFEYAQEKILQKNKSIPKTTPKPTHHLMIALPDDIDYEDSAEKINEQKTILEFAKEFLTETKCEVNFDNNTDLSFISDIFKEMTWALEISKDKELNWDFCKETTELTKMKKEYDKIKNELQFYFKAKNNKVTNDDLSKMGVKFSKSETEKIKELKIQIGKKYKEIENKTNYSFLDYVKTQRTIYEDNTKTKFLKNKFMKMNTSMYSEPAKRFYEKSGISLKHEKTKSDYAAKTIEFDENNCIDFMTNYFNKKSKYEYCFKEIEYLTSMNILGTDSVHACLLKEESINYYKQFYNLIKDTNSYVYSHFCHYFYQQLMHTSQLNSSPNHFSFMNCGIKNMCIIVANTYNTIKHDVGKPFMTIVKTRFPELYTNGFFGKVKEYKLGKYTYVISNWRRLTQSKITFMRDTFYSTISSTMNSVLSSPDPPTYLLNNKLQKIFTTRTIIGYSTNQKISEILLDLRYAYMSSLSIYTNIAKLLEEKFGPPYHTHFETWIVSKIFKNLKNTHTKAITDGIYQHKIEITSNVRDINSIGGLINLPSFWNDYEMKDITELLDEVFIYVHTMKEPANIFHENIKALRTILQFQEEFDSLSNDFKFGTFKYKNDFRKFLIKDTKIGCSTSVIIESTKYTLDKEKPNIKKIINKINDESIGELLSTKAVISDLEREVTQSQTTSKRDQKRKKIRMQNIENRILTPQEEENIKMYVITTHSKFYAKTKPRQKVMETVLERLEENPNLTTTARFANEFIKKDKGKVIADICIKAQYGSKREFYVVNIGAKSLARLTENFFKEISMNSQNEAISIPGDEKTLEMQSMLDRIFFNPLTENHKLMYVNGDCAKWSAAETMSSFIAMSIAFKPKLTDKMYNVLLSTFNAWSQKEIQIPLDVYNKVVPNKGNKTEYLGFEDVIRSGKIKSTQNFLQGMFNYSSSYKAVCCINYTYYIWKKIYPESKLMIEHMEHSDDYVLLILYEDIEDFERFRVLQKMMMRLHGYNDSERKTSCQPFLMEFVSQLSFNGVMLYPQIKKSKEINLSLPCTGYVTDMEAALSRVGECSRVGCNQSFLYFFQRLHNYCVAEAYSILPGMSNNYNRDFQELHNTPLQLFGLSDMLPVFSLFCRGNGNNHRLYTYGNDYQKKLIYFLYEKAEQEAYEEDYMSENIDYKYTLQTPRFMYEMYNRSIKKLRKSINIETSNIKLFWEEHISYKFIKPRNVDDLIVWIKCMFYNVTFLEAYAKSTRTAMTMRLSKFVKAKIVKNIIKINDYETKIPELKLVAYNMREYYDQMMFDFFDFKKEMTPEINQNIVKITTKCDPTYSAIYSIIKVLSLTGMRREKSRTIQIAKKTPSKLKTIPIINEPAVLIQYLLNKDDFIKDKRTLISRESLENDFKIIQNRIGIDLTKKMRTMEVLSIYNDLMINKEARIVMFGYNRHSNNLVDTIQEIMSHNFVPGYIISAQLTHVINIQDPMDGKTIYTKGSRLTPDFFRQCIENITLIYVYLRFYMCVNKNTIISVLDQIKFNDGVNTSVTYTVNDIINKLSIDYINNFNYNLEEKKMIAFIKATIGGRYDVLDDLANSIYSFSYKYILKDKLVGNKYLGETELIFTYFNTTNKVYYNEKIFNQPLVFINKYYHSVMPTLYNVAIKTTIGMTDMEFEKTLNTNRMPLIKITDLKNFQHIKERYKLTHVVKYSQDYGVIVRINMLKNDDFIIPVFLTQDIIKRGGEIKYTNEKVRPNLVEETMSVFLGKSKLFTMPFWKCKQYDNMTYSGKYSIDNINFSELIKNRNLEKFVQGIHDRTLINVKLREMNSDQFENYIHREIKKHKIYDLDFTNLINTNSNVLNDLLKCTPSVEKTYEKRIFKDKDIFVENIKMADLSKFFDIKDEKVELSDQKTQEKYEVKNWFELNDEPKSMEDMLRKNANKMNFDDDFLIDEDDYDIPMVDQEDIFSDDLPDRNYYEKNDLMKLINVEYKMSDFFVLKPGIKKEKKDKREGVGYMLQKLKSKESLCMIMLYNDYKLAKKSKHLSIMNYLIVLDKIISIYPFCKNNDIGLKTINMLLYHFFVDIFITKSSGTCKYIVNDRTLNLCVNKKIQSIPKKQLEMFSVKKMILHHKDEDIYIKINKELAYKYFYEDIKNNLEKIVEFKCSEVIDEEYIDIIKKELEFRNSVNIEKDMDELLHQNF